MSVRGWLSRSLDVPRWLRSGGYAFSGVVSMLGTQSTIWFHVLVLAAFGIAGAWLEISPGDWRWLVAGVAMVLAAEALNTGLEFLCDRVTTENDELVRKAKDCGAGAVLVSAVAAWTMNALTLWPYVAAKA